MFKRLSFFIEKHNILYDRQFGFRKKHSTSYSTLLIADRIQQAIKDGIYSCGIFLDFSKAFDTVNQSIVMKKLNHYGVRRTTKDWFGISYLSIRKQHVSEGTSKPDDLFYTLLMVSHRDQYWVLFYFCYTLKWLMILVSAVNFRTSHFCRWHKSILYKSKFVCIRNIY